MPEWVECEISQILLVTDDLARPQVLVLREKPAGRSFMLHVGIFEAMAVKRHVYGETSARPLTHDLLMTVLSSLGGKLLRVAVSDLVEDASGNGIFYGFLVIGRGSDEIVVDCRPSDAIAMAARAGCPIFVSREVLDKVAGF